MATSDDDRIPTGLQAQERSAETARREFLQKCGKFAAYTAPAIAALLLCDTNDANGGS
jgi:hypothetical protein